MSEDFTQAIEARTRLARYLRSKEGMDAMLSGGRVGTGEPQELLEYANRTRNLLEAGPLHYVAEPVCETLHDHADLLPPTEVLKRTSFMHPDAFYYFASPLTIYEDAPYAVHAISIISMPWGVILDLYGVFNPFIWVGLDWEYGYPIEPGAGGPADEAKRASDRNVRQTMLALSLFERQTLTVSSREAPNRTARRRWEREHPNEPAPDITVIRLRRQISRNAPADDVEEGDVRHHRRHWVDPFWRNHWYPSEEEHHPLLVIGHWRGQGEATFPTKVYVVDR